RQIQTYVNERTAELASAIFDAFQSFSADRSGISWVSPLAADRYSEYRDGEFLKVVGAGRLAPQLRAFWPRGGPCWDALARLSSGGCILLEAKSHVSEVYGNGCAASMESVSLIRSSIAQTKAWVGASPNTDWMGRLYQSANRIAFLYFLREIAKVDAYLVNLYFTGDPHSPTTRREWDIAIENVNQELGISTVLGTATVFLPAS
ncbi:MAG TPA: hypothetical protein VKR26_10190, partial [Terriglobales bacterium]|nr:hypothetical protein [Terriglobales bacterium]